MIDIITWSIYGLLVGSISKSIVPGEENFGFIKTIFLGVAGSYVGGSILYMIGSYSSFSPAGVFAGVLGAVIALVFYNKLMEKYNG